MSISPPSPDGSTGMTVFTFGSALTDTSLTAPVVRSATSADLLSGCMSRPLVLSRQPCITPGAGHSLGNGLSGNGGGGGGVELGGAWRSGSVVNGCDAESLNCAQPAKTSSVEQSAVSPRRPDHHDCIAARLRISRLRCPRRGGARLFVFARKRWPTHGDTLIGTAKAPLKSPIQVELPLP